MSFTPNTSRHEPDWLAGPGGEFCAACGRDRKVPNLLHPPFPNSPFRAATSRVFGVRPAPSGEAAEPATGDVTAAALLDDDAATGPVPTELTRYSGTAGGKVEAALGRDPQEGRSDG